MASAVFLAGLSGCGDSMDPSTSPTAPSAEVAAAGTYALVQGNGQTLPVATGFTDGNCARFIDSGTLVLNSAGDYEFTLPMHAVCPTPGGGTNTVTNTPQENGTWSISRPVLTLTRSGGSVLNASNSSLANGSVTTTVRYEWAGQLPPVGLVLRKQ